MIWTDPILPPFKTITPQELRENPVRFGNYYMTLSLHQWQFVNAPERFVAWVAGVRGAKTWGGIAKALKHTIYIPHNRGIIGREFASDLELTTQRDFIEIADATGLVKNRNEKRVEMYCWDAQLDQVRADGATSEVLFQHLDNPKHIKGHGLGWGWIDEASEVNPRAYFRLVDRLSRPAAEGQYTVFLTSNPEGRNWVWNHFFNPETVEKRPIKDRLAHRAIHSKTSDSPFISEEYVTNLLATAPAEWVRRYVDAEFDVFEGQIFKEFSHDVHVISSRRCRGWEKGQPPSSWSRYMGIDTGGSDPWAFEISAVDPYGNLICYDEIYRPETYIRNFEKELKRKMGEFKFARIPMDYENQAAMEELRRMGIRVTNAVKMNKREGAINKLARYLHPNPLRRFPDWHPRRGELGSPGIFFTETVPKLIAEIPQQRWREINGVTINEADPHVIDHATHAVYYVIRERPEPTALLSSSLDQFQEHTEDIRSKCYWARAAEKKEQHETNKWSVLSPPTQRQRVWIN